MHDEIVLLDLDNASLLTSNLGGSGGALGTSTSTARVMRFGDVVVLPDGRSIDLEINNLSEYRAFKSDQNDRKPKSNGMFGAINVLAPESDDATAVLDSALHFHGGIEQHTCLARSRVPDVLRL